MTIKQLSIFIENKSGALLKVLEMLRDNGISIVVSTLGDTDGFGIYRVICDDTDKAFRLLRDQNISVTITNVHAVRLAENKPGAAASIVAEVSKMGVGIKYMYSFLFDGKGILVLRTDDADKMNEVVMLNKMDFLSEEDFR